MTLTLNDATFSRNDIRLFQHVNCTLQPGEMLQIRGANGCGKSTLLRMIAGYLEPDANSILWQNRCVLTQRDLYLPQICYLGHQNGLKPYLTVTENLKLSTLLTQQTLSSQQVDSTLDKMGLQHQRHTHVVHLSAGQRRRLALARLPLTAAKLWILDEPMTALDATGQTLFNDLLTQHLAQQGSAVIATHHDFMLTGAIQTLHLDEQAYA